MTAPASERTRGHRKKARTRQLLVRSAVEIIAERGEAFSVTDVVERAGVSNGTFYNYFEDRDDLVEQLVTEMIGAFTADSAAVVPTGDPALRFATISAMVLAWAATSPAVAQAILRLEVFQRAEFDDVAFGHLRQDLADGVAAGVFNGTADTVTVDVISGALFMAARRLVQTGPDQHYQEAVLARLLQSLGVGLHKARRTAAKAVAEAHGLGAER